MKKKITFCFDIDNTICKTSLSKYESSIPDKNAIKIINKLYEKGHTIKINTARYMGRNNDSIAKAKKQAKNLTLKQLKKWKVCYHKLIFGKPSYDIFIDDKAFGFSSKWKSYLKNYKKSNN